MAKRHLNRDGQPFFRKPKGHGVSPKAKRIFTKPTPPTKPAERLVACVIERGKQMVSRALKSHAEIRRFMGDANPYEEKPGDKCGFFTSTGRIVDRREAAAVGRLSGQLPPNFDREVLSSDIDWEADQ